MYKKILCFALVLSLLLGGLPYFSAPMFVEAAQPQIAFTQASPPSYVSNRHSGDGWNARDVRVRSHIYMVGVRYENPITFTASRGAVHSLHNLGGQYQSLVGYLGRADSGRNPTHNGHFRFYGDGRLLRAFDVRPGDTPMSISLDVSGVWQLKITFHNSSAQAANTFATYAFVGHFGGQTSLPPHTLVPPAVVPVLLVEAAPPTAVSHRSSGAGWNARDVRVRDHVIFFWTRPPANEHEMGFVGQFRNALTFTASRVAVYSLHQLDGRFFELSGTIAAAEESLGLWHNGRFRFYGDGVLISVVDHNGRNDGSIDISVDVTGVRQLRISFYNSSAQAANTFATYAFQGRLR